MSLNDRQREMVAELNDAIEALAGALDADAANKIVAGCARAVEFSAYALRMALTGGRDVKLP